MKRTVREKETVRNWKDLETKKSSEIEVISRKRKVREKETFEKDKSSRKTKVRERQKFEKDKSSRKKKVRERKKFGEEKSSGKSRISKYFFILCIWTRNWYLVCCFFCSDRKTWCTKNCQNALECLRHQNFAIMKSFTTRHQDNPSFHPSIRPIRINSHN